jgi:hypothetical protein
VVTSKGTVRTSCALPYNLEPWFRPPAHAIPSEKARDFLKPNARPELLPEAEARHERTLAAVSSRPFIGRLSCFQ